MNNLFVVDAGADWPIDPAKGRVIPAADYLAGYCPDAGRATRVFNLCRSAAYQGPGYYVSLLAEARGHHPWPTAATIADLQSPYWLSLFARRVLPLLGQHLAAPATPDCQFEAWFGHDPGGGQNLLAGQLFALLRAPLLVAQFHREAGVWHLDSLRLPGLDELSGEQRRLAAAAAADHLCARPAGERSSRGGKLAILHDPDGIDQPSDALALGAFAAAAVDLGLQPEFITAQDRARLPGFDALFIRDTTFAHHYTYDFARSAQDDGLVVIDDPESILRCNNKVFIAELLARHCLPMPRTLLVQAGNSERIVPELGLPCILKQPDGSFSVGVSKVDSAAALPVVLGELFEKSALVIAQEWLPTEFDWRVGILDRRILFVCKYHMAPGHWQIIDHHGENGRREGVTEALAVAEAPPEVLRLGLQAANLIGDGFYGVDIKQVGQRFCIIEINDNPNVGAGQEDGVLQDALYREVMAVFRRRLDQRQAGGMS